MRKSTMSMVAIALMAVMLFAFAGCSSGDFDEDKGGKISIAAMNGPTMIGLGKLNADVVAEGAESNYTITKEATPDAVIAGLASKTYDAACIPCNNAAIIFNKAEIDIQIAAINTLNVLYVLQKAGTDPITSLSDLSGKTVYSPGQGSTPEHIFKYLLNANNVQDVTVEFESEGSAIAAGLKVADSKYDYAVLPQPAATVAVSGAGAATQALNLTDEWKKISGNENTDIVTGVLVVRTDYLKNNKAAFEKFLADYEASVDFMTTAANIDTAAQYVVDMGIVPQAPVAKNALPKCGIDFIKGNEMKTMVSHFLGILNTQNSASVGGQLPADKFYYVG